MNHQQSLAVFGLSEFHDPQAPERHGFQNHTVEHSQMYSKYFQVYRVMCNEHANNSSHI